MPLLLCRLIHLSMGMFVISVTVSTWSSVRSRRCLIWNKPNLNILSPFDSLSDMLTVSVAPRWPERYMQEVRMQRTPPGFQLQVLRANWPHHRLILYTEQKNWRKQEVLTGQKTKINRTFSLNVVLYCPFRSRRLQRNRREARCMGNWSELTTQRTLSSVYDIVHWFTTNCKNNVQWVRGPSWPSRPLLWSRDKVFKQFLITCLSSGLHVQWR